MRDALFLLALARDPRAGPALAAVGKAGNKRAEPHVFAELDLRDLRLFHTENFGERLL